MCIGEGGDRRGPKYGLFTHETIAPTPGASAPGVGAMVSCVKYHTSGPPDRLAPGPWPCPGPGVGAIISRLSKGAWASHWFCQCASYWRMKTPRHHEAILTSSRAWKQNWGPTKQRFTQIFGVGGFSWKQQGTHSKPKFVNWLFWAVSWPIRAPGVSAS